MNNPTQKPQFPIDPSALMVRRIAAFFASFLISPGAGQLVFNRKARGIFFFIIAALTVIPGPLVSIWAFWANLPLRLLSAIDAAFLKPKDTLLPWKHVISYWAFIMAATFGLKIGAQALYSGVVIDRATMAPLVLADEQVLVKKVSPKLLKNAIVAIQEDTKKPMKVGRIIATAGDRLRIEKNIIYLNGKEITQTISSKKCSYLHPKLDIEKEYNPKKNEQKKRPPHVEFSCRAAIEKTPSASYQILLPPETDNTLDQKEITVPEHSFFILSDNRALKEANIGIVKKERIIGSAQTIWWSANEKGLRWNRIGQSL